MKNLAFLLLASAAFAPRAYAYLPPAFYVYAHGAEQKGKTPPPGVVVTVSRPQGSGTEESLGSISMPNWPRTLNGWPSLDLLFANEGVDLIKAVEAFGIPVAKESDLLRASREQIAAMKEAPRPFYKPDRRMGLKRYKGKYAWVHKEGPRSIWIEKDTYLPLKIEGPCPDGVSDLPWAKSGDSLCELEFRNVYAVRRGNTQGARMLLWKEGVPLLFFSFDKVVPAGKSGSVSLDSRSNLSSGLQSIAETILR
jgi:hypothetical protein